MSFESMIKEGDARSIFYIRLPVFEIQSERMLDSTLNTRSLAIISSHHQNGSLVALSPEAEAEGLYPGLSVGQARKMSKYTRFLPYNNTLYDRVNHYIYQKISGYSPLVEPEKNGHYYLDMSGMKRHYKGLKQAAFLISKVMKYSINFEGQIGISSNKLLSNISTVVTEEDIFEIPDGRESQFLDPLDVSFLPSARDKKLEKLFSFLFLKNIRDIRLLTDNSDMAAILFGSLHRSLYHESRGNDDRLVMPPRKEDEIIHQLVLSADSNDIKMLYAVVRRLAEQTAYELRKRRQLAAYFKLEIHYNDGFKKFRKGEILSNSDADTATEAIKLFDKANERRKRIRSILTRARDFRSSAEQLDLFALKKMTDHRLSNTMDILRDKYGFESIMSAAAMIRAKGERDKAKEKKRTVIEDKQSLLLL
ncbi:hypothetical protein KAJ27_20005 [bacterium]|nr:hypothetical protein [bacterium]